MVHISEQGTSLQTCAAAMGERGKTGWQTDEGMFVLNCAVDVSFLRSVKCQHSCDMIACSPEAEATWFNPCVVNVHWLQARRSNCRRRTSDITMSTCK